MNIYNIYIYVVGKSETTFKICLNKHRKGAKTEKSILIGK